MLDVARSRRCVIALGIAVWTGSATVSRAFHESPRLATPVSRALYEVPRLATPVSRAFHEPPAPATPVSRAFHAWLACPSPIFLWLRARAAAELHRPARRLARRPDGWHTQPLNAHVNPIGGAWAPLPALPPKGLALQLWGPGSHPSGPAATFHAIELRRQEPTRVLLTATLP